MEFDKKNAEVLANLLADPATPEHVKIKILDTLVEDNDDVTFFDTLISENLDVGECPYCKHTNHWLVPEQALNERNIVTSLLDPRVKPTTTAEDCKQYEEACAKKKTAV